MDQQPICDISGVYSYMLHSLPALMFKHKGGVDALFQWEKKDLEKICEDYEVDLEMIEEVINNRQPTTHTIYVDVDTYHEWRKNNA